MEKVKEFLKKIPDWVKAVVASAVIIAVAVVVNDVVTKWAFEQGHKNLTNIKEKDFSYIFQVDEFGIKNGRLVIDGWVFKFDEDAREADFEIILYDYAKDKKYYLKMEDVIRDDVNKYFLCEYDYSRSGFQATIKSNKLDLENVNYEILIQETMSRNAIETGVYLYKGELTYVKPEKFVPLEVKGTDLENIIEQGIIRVYRPDLGVYVYQYEGALFWIAESIYDFDENGDTFIQYHLDTTQIENLPKERLEAQWYWDNIGFSFKEKELTEWDTGKYRVAKKELPMGYSIEKIWTGNHKQDWIWIEFFQPYYYFDK